MNYDIPVKNLQLFVFVCIIFVEANTIRLVPKTRYSAKANVIGQD